MLVDPNRPSLYVVKNQARAGSVTVANSAPASGNRAIMYGAVFVGGAAGSLLRELFALEIPGAPYLTSTFGINIVACFVLGWLYSIRNKVHAHVLHLGAVGFCGGLSTFSSFVAELERLAENAGGIVVFAIAAEISVGLFAAILGEAAGRRFHSTRVRE
ncbi:fluoride efflux transporter FluC [Ruegeria arenilitoris]|uniref:fluoride efflux transporter FluC n=1 Tax=Ruegeria arenilitoris TaxID=1173585 RepID=UPI0020C482A7|nr:CrcB family protein [Ruegeria arenilitoris]